MNVVTGVGVIALLLSGASEPRKAAPDFELKDADGKAIALSAYKGKVVLLDFWATWCHGCETEIPWFMDFASRYRDRGLAVIGAAQDDDGWTSVRPYVTEKKMNYPVVLGTGDLAQRYGVMNLPVTFLIDRDGRVAFVHAGLPKGGKEEIANEIEMLLGSSPKR
jgi:peroxiredoxin